MGTNGEDLRPLRRGTNADYFSLPTWFPAGNRLGYTGFYRGTARHFVESSDLQGNKAIARDAGPKLWFRGLAILESGDLFYSTDERDRSPLERTCLVQEFYSMIGTSHETARKLRSSTAAVRRTAFGFFL